MTTAVGPLEPLAAFLAAEEEHDRFSGAVVVERDGETLFAGAYGHAHLGLGVRNDLDTRFNVASITKMLTAVAVLQLVEAGDLALDTTVHDLLPDVAIGGAERITVEHLLTHRSGLGDYWTDRCRQRRSTLRTTADYLALVEDHECAFEPGTATAYGNVGYVLLGGIVERGAATDYYEHLREHVCRPAGMARADHLHLDHVEDFAHGYTYVEWEARPHPEYRTDNVFQYPVRGSAATGLYSPAPELVRFFRALREGRLLGPAWVDRMLHLPPDRPDGHMAFGTQHVPVESGVAVGHGGRAFGAATLLLHLPHFDATVCVLSNYDRPADKVVFAEIDRLLLAGAAAG